MGGLHCVSVSAFNRSQSKFTFKFSALGKQKNRKDEQYEESEWPRGRRELELHTHIYGRCQEEEGPSTVAANSSRSS